MGAMASQITSLTIVYSTVYSGADQSKHRSSASLAFVWGIHRGPGTGEFPAQMASNAENDSISWRHHVYWDGPLVPFSRFPFPKSSRSLRWIHFGTCYQPQYWYRIFYVSTNNYKAPSLSMPKMIWGYCHQVRFSLDFWTCIKNSYTLVQNHNVTC